MYPRLSTALSGMTTSQNRCRRGSWTAIFCDNLKGCPLSGRRRLRDKLGRRKMSYCVTGSHLEVYGDTESGFDRRSPSRNVSMYLSMASTFGLREVTAPARWIRVPRVPTRMTHFETQTNSESICRLERWYAAPLAVVNQHTATGNISSSRLSTDRYLS